MVEKTNLQWFYTPAAGACPFGDVKPGSYYEAAIAWAAESGIVTGYDETRFGPDDLVTREQLAAILYRWAQLKGIDTGIGEDTNILSYDDAFDISGYAIPALQWACGAGLLTDTDGKLAPAVPASRAQTAAALSKLCEVAGK